MDANHPRNDRRTDRQPTSRPTVDERGGRVGDVVVDADDDQPVDERSRAVVVNVPPVPADEWNVPGGGTVADHPTNVAYPADAPIAVVVYRDDLDEARPDYDGADPLPLADLAADRVQYYAFPQGRLEVVDRLGGAAPTAGVPDADPDSRAPAGGPGRNGTDVDAPIEPDPRVAALADRLRDGGMAVEVLDEDRLRAEKLGETYAVRADGTVDGDGALASQLGDVVDEVLDEAADEVAEVGA